MSSPVTPTILDVTKPSFQFPLLIGRLVVKDFGDRSLNVVNSGLPLQ
jgi:hypothetical protein